MSYPTYYVEAGDTLPHLFATFDGGDGSSITMTGLAVTDIEILKDGGATARSSDSGYALIDTDGIDIASITGVHGFTIDLSDNTDSGFYAVGSWYHVVVSSITVDSQTVNFVACAFRIVSATRGMAGTALPDAAADGAGGLPISDAGGLDLDAQVGTDIDAILDDTDLIDDATSGLAKIATDVAAVLVDTAEIGAAGAGLTEAGGTGDQLTAVPWNSAWDAEVQSEATDALNAYDPPTKAEMDTAVGTAQTGDTYGLLTGAHSEPTGVPAANETLADKIGYLFMALRNKVTVTSSKMQFYDDGDNAEWEKDLSDDGTTYTESEGNSV